MIKLRVKFQIAENQIKLFRKLLATKYQKYVKCEISTHSGTISIQLYSWN